MVTSKPKWVWRERTTSEDLLSGDVNQTFKNAKYKTPDLFRSDEPPFNASLLARELTQNSWDSAIERSGSLTAELELTFDFRRLEGEARSKFAEIIGINEMNEREEQLSGVYASRQEQKVLRDPEAPLTLLVVKERGTTGMYGSWFGQQDSKLYSAMLSMGFNDKSASQGQWSPGGSYGKGKAALVRASGTRTVIAYTCYEDEGDEGITRRLLGVNYWPPHVTKDGKRFTGFARFGDIKEDQVIPYANDDADQIAQSLGLDTRDPSNPDEWGTTFVMLQPTVQPRDLNKAFERNWWPAIVDEDGFEITTIDYDGKEHFPKPRMDPLLRPFIRSYEMAKMSQPDCSKDETTSRPNRYKLPSRGGNAVELGNIGLVGDENDWTFPSVQPNADDEQITHFSLVALVRSRRMVIEYFRANRNSPYVRGCFVADRDVDELLRQTEPALHDIWDPESENEGIDEDAVQVASQVTKSIKAAVGTFKKTFSRPIPSRGSLRLPLLDRIFKSVSTGGPTRPPVDPGPLPEFTISAPDSELVMQESKIDPKKIELTGPVKIDFFEQFNPDEDSVEIKVDFKYRFIEDDRVGKGKESRCPLTFSKIPNGFRPHPNEPDSFVGRVSKASSAPVFQLKSAPYDRDYLAELEIIVDRFAAPEQSAEV